VGGQAAISPLSSESGHVTPAARRTGSV